MKKKCFRSITADNYEPTHCIEDECMAWIKFGGGKFSGCSFVLESASAFQSHMEDKKVTVETEPIKPKEEVIKEEPKEDGPLLNIMEDEQPEVEDAPEPTEDEIYATPEAEKETTENADQGNS